MKMHGRPAPGQSRKITIREHDRSGCLQSTIIACDKDGALSLWASVQRIPTDRLPPERERRALNQIISFWRTRGTE